MAAHRESLRTVLVADSARATAELRRMFADHVHFVSAQTFEDAVRVLRSRPVHLVMIGYHFDELRPYRLIAYIRKESRSPQVPIVLVRLLAAKMGRSSEEQVREAYRSLGIQQFFSLPDELEVDDRAEALERIREQVFDLVGLGNEREDR